MNGQRPILRSRRWKKINERNKNMKDYINGANPYMPLWEHVPDGEPRVFEHNGEKRVDRKSVV